MSAPKERFAAALAATLPAESARPALVFARLATWRAEQTKATAPPDPAPV